MLIMQIQLKNRLTAIAWYHPSKITVELQGKIGNTCKSSPEVHKSILQGSVGYMEFTVRNVGHFIMICKLMHIISISKVDNDMQTFIFSGSLTSVSTHCPTW